jgi:hypothetical protein
MIRNFEAGRSEPRHAILAALPMAFEASGTEFIIDPDPAEHSKIRPEVIRVGVVLHVKAW